MPGPWMLVWILAQTYVIAVYLSYLQWLSDDSNFFPDYHDFNE